MIVGGTGRAGLIMGLVFKFTGGGGGESDRIVLQCGLSGMLVC